MDKDTLYWILSTLPQVIGAMTGLLVAGITFLFQSLDKEMEKDESSIPAISEMKQQIYAKTIVLLIVSILAILIDVISLGGTPWLSDKLSNLSWMKWMGQLIVFFICMVTVGINLYSFVMLFRILKKILNPDYQKNVNNSLAEKENRNISTTDSVSPQEFLDYFIKFERKIRDFFPHSLQHDPLRSLINQLVGENIISRVDVGRIQSIINKRNIFAHGGNIGRVDNNTIDFLTKQIAELDSKLQSYLENRRVSRMEEVFKIWIKRYVEDFSDAEQLDQAVRYERDYGIYKASKDGNRLYIHTSDGRPLYIANETSKKIFLKILEDIYSTGDGLSIEESTSFKYANEKDD